MAQPQPHVARTAAETQSGPTIRPGKFWSCTARAVPYRLRTTIRVVYRILRKNKNEIEIHYIIFMSLEIMY